MFVSHINVLITDIDVGALQNKIDEVIIDFESWFHGNDLIIIHKTVVCHFIIDKKSFL